jgi:hypothetical protein
MSQIRSMDQLIAWLFRYSQLPLAAPTPLTHLAHRLGADVVTADISENGRLDVIDGQITIVIRTKVASNRRRFTVAHEIGHIVLAHADLKLYPFRRRADLLDEERFCDLFAESLLLPKAWLERRFGRSAPRLRTVFACSNAAHVSLAASAIRLTRVLGWNRMLLQWRRQRGRWILLSSSGARFGRRDTLATLPSTAQLLDYVAAHGSPTGSVALPLGVEGSAMHAPAELIVRRGICFAWLDPTTLKFAVNRAPVRPRATGEAIVESAGGRRDLRREGSIVGGPVLLSPTVI